MEKLRFKQEDGTDYPEWKESALGDFLVPVRYERVENPEEHELLTVKLHGRGVKRTGAKPNRTENGRPYYKRQEGELLIGRQNVHNGGFGLVGAEESGLICSNAIGGYSAPGGTEYIFQFLSSIYPSLEKYTEGTGAKEIPQKAFHALKFNFPSLREQSRIATFLGLLDERIEAQRVLVSGLEQEKRGYMQAMLSSTPTLRFKQDDGTDYPDWEKTTLGEVAGYVKGRCTGRENLVFVDNLKSMYGGVSFSPEQARAESSLVGYTEGDILIGNIRPYLKKIWRATLEGAASPDVLVIRSKGSINPSFLYTHLANDAFFGYMSDTSRGTKMPRGDKGEILSFPIYLPSVMEQAQIASFFSLLDGRLQAEKGKLSDLELEKRGFAQRMFL